MENDNKQKRIGIDARFYGTKNKGLGRYTKEVVDKVIDLDQANDYVVFLRENNFNEFKPNNPRVKKVKADIRWYTLREQFVLPYIFWREKLDLMYFPHFNVPLFYPGKFMVTIHDLILTKHPTQRASTLSPLVYRIKNFAYKLVIILAIKRAKQIIAVSKFTASDIKKKFKVNSIKIKVVYEGVASDLKGNENKDDKKVISRYNIHRPYMLYVGNAYPHKNLEGLVKVFVKIKYNYPDNSLVLVGKEDYFYNRLKNFAKTVDHGEDIIFPGFVPDFDLVSFYRLAEVYVFPSFFEGFGLPPLEAMVHDCPVVSSNKTSLTEILEDAALYFDPDDQIDMQKKIEKVINNTDLRRSLIKKGQEQANKYSWQNCGAEILDRFGALLK